MNSKIESRNKHLSEKGYIYVDYENLNLTNGRYRSIIEFLKIEPPERKSKIMTWLTKEQYNQFNDFISKFSDYKEMSNYMRKQTSISKYGENYQNIKNKKASETYKQNVQNGLTRSKSEIMKDIFNSKTKEDYKISSNKRKETINSVTENLFNPREYFDVAHTFGEKIYNEIKLLVKTPYVKVYNGSEWWDKSTISEWEEYRNKRFVDKLLSRGFLKYSEIKYKFEPKIENYNVFLKYLKLIGVNNVEQNYGDIFIHQNTFNKINEFKRKHPLYPSWNDFSTEDEFKIVGYITRKDVIESIDKDYTTIDKIMNEINIHYVKDGVGYYLKNEDFETLKDWCKNNYSKEYFNNKTCMEKYGVMNGSQTKESREKISTKVKESCTPERQEKIIKTKLEKYGKKSITNVEKSIQSKLEKYGTLTINHRYLFDNIYFDSSWEIYFYIYHHNILKDDIKRGPVFEYYLDGTKHLYECDFEIDGKYYEIKGPQYLKDGKLYFPYSENKEYQQEVWNAKNECMKSNNVQIISDIEHIKKSVDEMYTEDFVDLFRIDAPFPYTTEIRTQLDICRVFHKSLYEATRLNKPSPYNAWFDKNLVYKCAMNRLQYVHSCTPNDIIKGFQISMIAPKVSIFKPTLAERLIKTYLNDYYNIYDPFSGFSGRLIGANNCNKHYYGFDINKDHINESNEIIGYLNCKESCNVKVQDLLNDSIHTLDSDSCLFTCPPYGGKEHWNKNNDEVEKSCDEWIDVCMDKYKCDKYLFVVDKTEKYKDYIVETISNKSHFGENKEYVVLINK